MSAQQQFSVRGIAVVVSFSAIVFCFGTTKAHAQDQEPSSPVADTAKQVILDPTTYAPASIAYDATMRDWNTSQPFFRNGFLERNPHYTSSGFPFDRPMSYSDGHRRIVLDAVTNLGTSLAHNTAERSLERMLLRRHPNHTKLIRTLGWVERISFGAAMSYVLAAQHYRQAQLNARQANQLGIR